VTGILAFIPNVGAIVSGVLMVLIGFSAGNETGPVGDRRLLRGAVHRRLSDPALRGEETVDLGPALVQGAQLIFGALFGLMGPGARRSAGGDDQGQPAAKVGGAG
jgi:hypothetical protein